MTQMQYSLDGFMPAVADADARCPMVIGADNLTIDARSPICRSRSEYGVRGQRRSSHSGLSG